MFRLNGVSLAAILTIAAILVAAASAQAQQRRADEYSRAYGFRVDIQPGPPPGSDDKGWEHVSDGLVSITHLPPTPDVKPGPPLLETVMKFVMVDVNGQRAGVELKPCEDFSSAICAVFTYVEMPKSITSWIKPMIQPEALIEHRDLVIQVSRQDGATRTFNLIDSFPKRFDYVELSPQGAGTVIRWRLEVRVERIEMK